MNSAVQEIEESAAWWWSSDGLLRRAWILVKVGQIMVDSDRAEMDR